MTKKKAIYTIDGGPTKLLDVTSRTQDAMLKEAPENYISARHLHKELGIWATTARIWRNRGKIRAKKVRSTWFYSRQDLSNPIEQLNKKMYPITMNGKPTTLRDAKHAARDAMLRESLGDYISAKDIHANASIKNTTLRRWRNDGRIQAEKAGGTWYYSRQDLIQLIKTSQ